LGRFSSFGLQNLGVYLIARATGQIPVGDKGAAVRAVAWPHPNAARLYVSWYHAAHDQTDLPRVERRDGRRAHTPGRFLDPRIG
jgi:hypothetical protein